jgi:hypothetical protein
MRIVRLEDLEGLVYTDTCSWKWSAVPFRLLRSHVLTPQGVAHQSL